MAAAWTPPLKLWAVGPDFVAAASPKQAIQLVMDHSGCGLEDIGDTLAEPYAHEHLTITMDAEFRNQPAVPPGRRRCQGHGCCVACDP